MLSRPSIKFDQRSKKKRGTNYEWYGCFNFLISTHLIWSMSSLLQQMPLGAHLQYAHITTWSASVHFSKYRWLTDAPQQACRIFHKMNSQMPARCTVLSPVGIEHGYSKTVVGFLNYCAIIVMFIECQPENFNHSLAVACC